MTGRRVRHDTRSGVSETAAVNVAGIAMLVVVAAVAGVVGLGPVVLAGAVVGYQDLPGVVWCWPLVVFGAAAVVVFGGIWVAAFEAEQRSFVDLEGAARARAGASSGARPAAEVHFHGPVHFHEDRSTHITVNVAAPPGGGAVPWSELGAALDRAVPALDPAVFEAEARRRGA